MAYASLDLIRLFDFIISVISGQTSSFSSLERFGINLGDRLKQRGGLEPSGIRRR